MFKKSNQIPKLAIVGFGAFGQLIARHLRHYLPLVVCDPLNRPNDLRQVDLAGAAESDIVVLAVPLPQLERVLHELAPRLRPGTIVIDVASVKVAPARVMQDILPQHVQIIASHPLFGPESARNGIEGHRIAWCPLRGEGHRRVAALLRHLGLKLIATTPDRHDRDMAVVQGLTHLIARALDQMGAAQTALTTQSYLCLSEAVAMVRGDSPELLNTILTANPYAEAARQKFLSAAQDIGNPG